LVVSGVGEFRGLKSVAGEFSWMLDGTTSRQGGVGNGASTPSTQYGDIGQSQNCRTGLWFASRVSHMSALPFGGTPSLKNAHWLESFTQKWTSCVSFIMRTNK
jgi:hypothetical protein